MLYHENQNAKSIEEWKKRMKIFISYIKTNILWVIFFIALILFQTVYMHLAGISQNDCIYGLILGSIVFLVVFCSAFAVYFKKYKKLQRIELLDIDEQSDMPETSDCIEQLYQDIVENQVISRKQMRADKDKTNSEMLQYYGMWVHQIKTPIAAMHLLLQTDLSMAADDESEEEIYFRVSELKKELSNELFRIEQYTEMALEYQRVQSESNDFVLGKIKLDKVIRESIRKYAKIFIRKKLSMHYEGTDIVVASDEKWLSFIIEQILSNAIKYTKAGSITINVLPNALNKIVCLEIADDGIGISAEDIPRVFEKGYTGYNGHENKSSTGIGLYLCKQTADKLGHRLEIESEKKKGTKVRIYFYT